MAKNQFLAVAVRAARAAATVMRRYQREGFEVGFKKNRADLVTVADRETERRIRSIIGRAFPQHGVLAEEGGAVSGDGRHRWLIDPIDGTINYVAGFPYYCTSIALEIDGRVEVGVIFDPERRELFTAQRGGGAFLNGRRLRVRTEKVIERAVLVTGYSYSEHSDQARDTMRVVGHVLTCVRAVRRVGAAALDLANVAAGRFDGFWEAGLNPWDVAAGMLLVEEAGGRTSNGDGRRHRFGDPLLVATNRTLHRPLLRLLQTSNPEL